MPSISARHYRVVDRETGWLQDCIRLRRRSSWWPITSRVYYLYLPSPLSPLAGRVQRRRRSRWGRKAPLPAKVVFALAAAAIRDGALPVKHDN